MEALIGLAAAILGALAALMGQRLGARAEAHRQWLQTLLTQCAVIVSLERMVAQGAYRATRGQAWHPESWDANLRYTADAQIRLITHHGGLRAALDALHSSGRKLSIALLDHAVDAISDDELLALREPHWRNIADFEAQATAALRAEAVLR